MRRHLRPQLPGSHQNIFGHDPLLVIDFIITIIGRKLAKSTRFSADPTVKATWRFLRSWVCHNHKIYYSYVIGVAFGVYNFWWYTLVGYYRRRNEHRSLRHAILREKEWALIKPKEEEEEEEEETTAEPAAAQEEE